MRARATTLLWTSVNRLRFAQAGRRLRSCPPPPPRAAPLVRLPWCSSGGRARSGVDNGHTETDRPVGPAAQYIGSLPGSSQRSRLHEPDVAICRHRRGRAPRSCQPKGSRRKRTDCILRRRPAIQGACSRQSGSRVLAEVAGNEHASTCLPFHIRSGDSRSHRQLGGPLR